MSGGKESLDEGEEGEGEGVPRTTLTVSVTGSEEGPRSVSRRKEPPKD